MNLLLVAGEASGEMYGAELAREIRSIRPETEIWGCGGDRMAGAGVEIVYPIREFSVLGFSEVVSKIPFFLRALARMKRLVRERRPAAVVLVDFPGFNMRLASFCRREGVPVVWYVGPQVWAWGGGRVKKLRKLVDLMLVILPFEEEYYRESGVPVRFVGHPLVDLVRPARDPMEWRARRGVQEGRPLVGLFPGSRVQEVEKLLPVMTGALRRLREGGRELEARIGAAPTLGDDVYRRVLGPGGPPLVRGETHDLLGASLFAFVASGTMTVEAACLETPMAIVYKVSPLSWWIGKRLVRVPHIGMANLLAGERVVPELLQHDATEENLAAVARPWIDDPPCLAPVRAKLRAVREGLGGGGASRRAAESVLEVAEGGR